MEILPNKIEANYYPITIKADTSPPSPANPAANTPAVAVENSNILNSANGSVVGTGTVQSPNFLAGAGGTGWRLDSNGNLEASNGNFRGSITGASGTFSGTITASTGTIGGWSINDISIYTGTEDHSGYTANPGDVTIYSDGSNASIHANKFYIDANGEIFATSATLSGAITTGVGSSIASAYLSGVIAQANLDVGNRGWSQTCAFTVTDADTIAWGAGTLTSADGTAYTISAGNTGNMVAKTYVYLDTAVSTTVYQTTTTAATSVGTGKVLVAIAQNGTGEATFQVFNGQGGLNINGSNIVAGSLTADEIADLAITEDKIAASTITAAKIATGTITANEIAAGTITTDQIAANTIVAGDIAAGTITGNEIAVSTITAGKMSVSTLSSIIADMGAITAGTITMDSAGYIRGGQTAYNTGTGFFLGYSTAAYKFSIGVPTGDYLTWDGANLTVSASRIVKLFTAGMPITAGEVVFMHTDGKVYSGDATYAAQTSKAFGICLTTTATNASAPIQTFGTASGLSSLTIASTYYLQNATHTIDQQNTTSNGTNGQLNSERYQSFTTGVGIVQINKIQITVSSGEAGSSTITVNLKTGEGTGGTLLATGTFSAPNGSTAGTVYFAAPVNLTAETQYSITATSSLANVYWVGDNTNPYAGGRNDIAAGNDYLFKTYYSTGRGALGTGAGTTSKIMGFATSATELQLNYVIT